MKKKLSRLLWPDMLLYFILFAAFAVAAGILRHYELAVSAGIVCLSAYLIFRISRQRRKRALAEFVEAAAGNNSVDSAVPFPAVLVQPQSGEILWSNQAFSTIEQDANVRYLSELFPDFTIAWLQEGKTEAPESVTHNGCHYRISGTLLLPEETPGQALASLFFIDETQLLLLKEEYAASRPVVCIILIDNYDELTNNLPDSGISSLNAGLDARIKHWADGVGGLLRKLERNRYLFLLEARNLSVITNQKFSILESIRSIVNPRGIHATISLGIGRDGADFDEGYTFANLAIEMSLARGGDQAVIKDRYNFSFYGGRNVETDRRTKVKTRVMANSLCELISQSSHIFIMGHKNADLDSVGAACGIACICRKLNKKAMIIIDREKNAAATLVQKLEKQPEYHNCLISGQDALLMADPKSLLIVVDTNRPSQTECMPLLECISRVCIIDHHRRAADYIDSAVLNLHDPFASSASELVTELLNYAAESTDLLPVEAQALLSGIVLDTKNFAMRTSSRTFESAAFLRRLGADMIDVKLTLQNDLDSTIQRYQIVQEAQIYRNNIAIAALEHPTSRIIAAQAADELLTISGITTSFVLYPDPKTEQVIISARSFGNTNVQVILEPLGGGGNAAIAGAQLSGQSISSTLTALLRSIDQFFETA